jgi:hypothetical protein
VVSRKPIFLSHNSTDGAGKEISFRDADIYVDKNSWRFMAAVILFSLEEP